jgi:adenylate cyclase
VQEVGRQLGVRYVLEGSVRKQGDRVRITAQLIDAQKGGHVWSETYDRDMKDIFAVQDEITIKVMNSLRVKLTEGEQVRHWVGRAGEGFNRQDCEACEKIIQAGWYMGRGTADGDAEAQKLIEEVITLEPQWAFSYSMLAIVHMKAVYWGWSKDPRESVRKAHELAKKALSLKESLDLVHWTLGYIYALSGRYDEAVAEGERAVELNPNGADALAVLGGILNSVGRPEEAIPLLHKAMRMKPMPSAYYYANLGTSYRLTEQYDKAIAEFEKGLRVSRDHAECLLGLAVTYSQAGREKDARKSITEFLRTNPKYSLEHAEKVIQYKDPAVKKRTIDALHKAGLK